MGTQSIYAFEYDLGLIDKQIRMLRALVDVSPVVHHPDTEKSVGVPKSDVEFVAVSRRSLNDLVEELELRVGVLKQGLERLKN